jgi:hypothetical protein
MRLARAIGGGFIAWALFAGTGGTTTVEPAFWIGIARPPLEAGALARVRDSGANSFRRTLAWSEVRGADEALHIPAKFREAIRSARNLGLEPLVVLSYGHPDFDGGGYPRSKSALSAFGEFADFAVKSLGSDVKHWELWNEWNRGTGMPAWAGRGPPEAYVRFVESVAPSCRKSGAAEQVWGGGMEGIGRANRWTERAVQAGLMKTVDGLTFHPYTYFLPPGERMPERGLMSFMQELEANIGKDKAGRKIPLYVTELGWPTHSGPDGVTLEEQAKYTARALFLLRANPRVRGVWIYTLYDRAGSAADLENHFGLLFSDGTPKPAWYAFRDAARLLRNATKCERLDFGRHRRSLAGVALAAAPGDATRQVVLWAVEPLKSWKVILSWPGSTIRLPSGMEARILGTSGLLNLPISVSNGRETCELTVTDMPVILSAVPANATVERVELRKVLPP